MSNHFDEDMDDDQVNEEAIVNAILELGNDILKSLGVKDKIDDVGVFFGDAFYIQFFEVAFPEIDFSQLEEAQNEEEMAANIQTLIDLLGSQILKYDLSHIRGEEIVNGNPEHCINLLQLVQEIASMLDTKEGSQSPQEDEDYDLEPQAMMGGSTAKKNNLQQEEDNEAQLIHERRQKQQQQSPNRQGAAAAKTQSQQKQSSNKRGRSYSDDKTGGNRFNLDEIDISNEFDVNMDDDEEEDEEDEAHKMMIFYQQQQQQQQQKKQSADNSKQNIQQKQQKQQIIDHYQEEDENDDEEEEIDEDDLKMYEQFLANNKNQEQQLAMLVDDHQPGQAPGGPQDHQEEGEDDDEEIDLDNIDYDDLDPQILELAEQMGVHPKEVIKQMLKMQQEEGYGDEEDDEEGEIDEEQLQQQIYMQQQQQKQQQQQRKQQQQQSSNKKQQARSKPLPHELIQQDSDQESYYSEGELISRDKIAHRKAYSAPYIIMNYCFDEPLYDSEDENELERANSTNIIDNIHEQERLAQALAAQGSEDDEMDEETAQMLLMQQQLLQQQQQQQKHHSKITEVSKSKESSQFNAKNKQNNSSSQTKKSRHQQQQQEDDDDDYEVDIDVGQKLQQLQNQQNQQQQQYGDEEGEGEDEDDDEDVLIDLDKLDETNKAMLLEYLQQEYQKNPDQFPFPKELIEQQLMKQQNRQETESVRDIKSDEMIVEDTSQQQHQYPNGIEGGEHEVEQEDEDEEQELTHEQQMQLQHLLMQQQQQQQQEEYEDDHNQAQMEQLQQMQQQYQQQQQQLMPRQLKPKFKKSTAAAKTGTKARPKSAGKRKPQVQGEQQILHEQQQQLIQMIQNGEIDVENIDPNILQQLIMAQSQEQMMYQQQQQQQQQLSRPRTAKRKTSVPKKKSLQKLMPYQMPQRSMKVLGPSTPGTHLKSFNTNRSTNQTLSKKKSKRSASKKQAPPMPNQYAMGQDGQQQHAPQGYEMPILSEEYLNQLSEEELQQLLEHQQQLMMIQQHQQQTSQMRKSGPSVRPKSAKAQKSLKPPKIPATYQQYYQPYMNRKPAPGKAKKKGKKRRVTAAAVQDHGGVMMNNYFPALEGGNQLIGQSQHTDDGGSLSKDSRYPKFSHEVVNNPSLLQQQQQEAIHEVPPEQEEGESQELHAYHPGQEQSEDDQDGGDQVVQDQDIQQEGLDQDQDGQETDPQQDEAFEISDEQLIQLMQNAHNLSQEQQLQLQMILQERMRTDPMNDRAKSYEDIYQILMENVKKAKDRLANLGLPNGSLDNLDNETDRRILRQKQEFEALYRQYNIEMKQRQTKMKFEDEKGPHRLHREQKIQAIKERKFQEELMNHQKSLNYKRKDQQALLCQKVFKLASDLEKNKLLAEKKQYKESIQKKKHQSRMMVDALENFYKNMITMLKEKIENERRERMIAQQAQQHAMSRMKRELNMQKKQEVDRYLQLLKQEDQRYDFESTNLQRIEGEILKLYKR